MSAVDALHARWSLDAGEHEHVVFLVEGMHCAACARSIEKAVRALPDVDARARQQCHRAGLGRLARTRRDRT